MVTKASRPLARGEVVPHGSGAPQLHALIGEIYFSSLAIQTHLRLPCQTKLMVVTLGFRSFGQTRSCPFSRVLPPPYVCPWLRSEVLKGFAQKGFARLLLIVPWCPLF